MKQKLLLLLCIVTISFQPIQAQSPNEQIAENWIQQNKSKLKIQDHHSFKMLFNRKGPSGETLRYYQMVNGVRVYNAELTIHINTIGDVSYVANAYNRDVDAINTNPAISADEAYNTAIRNLNNPGFTRKKEEGLFVYPLNGETKLVYSFKTSSENLNGYWETIVDANSGDIISSKDIALYHKRHNNEKEKKSDKEKNHETKISAGNNTAAVMATGTAMVFDPDPLSVAQVAYGGQYVDNNDATNASLSATRTQVNLPDIEFSGGTYRLKGTYAEIASLQNPSTGLFTQASNAFHFTRNEQGFEAAQVYYHVDKSIRYINQTLGITLVSRFNNGVVEFDPHAHNGADQSTYGGGELNFGEGGIDDGECTDVILHELGHGLHDWVTNGGLSQENGLSEGSGDYWAQSYSRSVNGWTTGNDPHNLYNKVFKWDGNSTWNGRRSDVSAQYPGGLVGQIHTDGQIWATVLMEIYDIIGKTKIDAAFLEGLGMTNSSTNQPQAATAVRQAAMDMVIAGRFGMTCADVDAMTARFNARGYNLPALNCTTLSTDEFLLVDNISIFPNPTNNNLNFKNVHKSYEVEVFNLLGQKIIATQINENNTSINVSNLSNGTYLVKFKNIDGALKFVKL
ncbi:T9SS type A sorting domain-containing protein [Pseudofulvibacter geojedonensis]|uniref:T9SS type A sorting domain-containing protein n=1 Tax=Pseudofulvibacter geojedonensis TaxID=1123758 RepID=A0ABW3HZR0_9FLAO